MPFWPFKKRRRNSASKAKEIAFEPLLEEEKAQPDALLPPPRAPTRATNTTTTTATTTIATPTIASGPPTGASSPIPIPRRSSKRDRNSLLLDAEKRDSSYFDKENVPPGSPAIFSADPNTALPMTYQLQHSPHLRPVDLDRPPIPYNFRTYSGSQTSMPPDANSPRPNVLRKKRSSYDAGSAGTPQRKRSSRSRKDEAVREEEIRAMSAQSPIPKRPGEGPLRRDSKKMRSGRGKESEISLPAHEESVRETLPGIVEQRGWEVGVIDVFNPRPAVRLSGTPQYVTPGSPPTLTSSIPDSPELLRRKDKAPVSRDGARKRETIGSRADDFDANDIRLILERDAKRREQRKKEQQEKLDRKLRKREGRNRGDSDVSRREAKDKRRAEEKARAEEPVPPMPPLPAALQDSRDSQREVAGVGAVGLGIAAAAATAGAVDDREPPERVRPSIEKPTEDPFADPVDEQVLRPSVEQTPGTYTPSETHMDEDVVVETAQAVRMSQASTPPLSPVHSMRAKSNLSQIASDSRRASDIPLPAQANEARRASQPAPERRTGALASLFRRSGTNAKKGPEAQSAPSEASFSNTSRESMRNQPLPPHLVETPTRVPASRSVSGTPVRTQSKFREDLPELPISPPDSRTASPDVTMAAAAAAAARRAQRSSQPADVQRQGSTTTSGSEAAPAAPRYDTPISPSLRPGTSLASVDSEGAWLASGTGKRQSKQSGLGARRAEFTASYEELGGDTDAQHFTRAPAHPESVLGTSEQSRTAPTLPVSSEVTSANNFDDAQEDIESPIDTTADAGTPTVRDSVRRRPTLVHRDPRFQSREGLVTEVAGDIVEPASATTGRGSMEMESDFEGPEPELERATSVRLHARNVSTGSAKLLQVSPRRGSQDVKSEASASAGPASPKI